MGGFMDDEYVAEAQQLVVTEGFASLNEVVFRNKLTSRRAMVRAQIYGREGVEGVDASEVVHYRTYEDCLEAVNSGCADIHETYPSPTPGAYTDGRSTTSRRRPPPSIAGQPLRHRAAGGRRPVLGAQQGREQPFARRARRRLLARPCPRSASSAPSRRSCPKNPLLVVALGLVLCLFVERHRDRDCRCREVRNHDGDEAGRRWRWAARRRTPLAHVSRSHARGRHHRPVRRGVAVGRATPSIARASRRSTRQRSSCCRS